MGRPTPTHLDTAHEHALLAGSHALAYRVRMRIRTVCFDFDRTLGYMSPSHWTAYADAARACGIDITPEALAAIGVESGWARWDTPLGPAHPEASVSEATFHELRASIAIDRLRAAGVQADEATLAAAGRRAADFECDPARYRLYDDTLPALTRLAEAHVECIVISNHVWALPEIVASLGASFTGVVTSARVGYRKPHPEIFRAALRLTSARPEEIVMVGDSVSADVRGAEGVRMHAVFIDREGADDVPGDVHVIGSLLDVPLEWPPA